MKLKHLLFFILLYAGSTVYAVNSCKALFESIVEVKANEQNNENRYTSIKFTDNQRARQLKKDKKFPDRFKTDEKNIGWGTKLLSEHDPTWSDPVYLRRLKEFAAPNITNYGGKAESLWIEYKQYFNNFFEGNLRQVFSSGTDANNYLYLWARDYFLSVHKREPKKMKFLTFGSEYGGSYGPITQDILRTNARDPVIDPNTVLSKEDLVRQESIEKQAIEAIRSDLKNKSVDIGAIFLEPISVNHGLKMYRLEFIEKLSKLADQYRVPIYCDEIFTGGGRTGKFWAFQHYQNDHFRFVPDLVTFGKGFGVSGIFQPDGMARIHDLSEALNSETISNNLGYTKNVYLKNGNKIKYVHSLNGNQIVTYDSKGKVKAKISLGGKRKGFDSRAMIHRSFTSGRDTTTNINALALLQSLQLVKTIWDRRLDKNAAEAGKHLNLRIQQHRSYILNNNTSISEAYLSRATGIGLLFNQNFTENGIWSGGYGRLVPLITTTKEDIDWALSEHLGWKFDPSVKDGLRYQTNDYF